VPGVSGIICPGRDIGPGDASMRPRAPRWSTEPWRTRGVGGVCGVASLLAGGAGGRQGRGLRSGPGKARSSRVS